MENNTIGLLEANRRHPGKPAVLIVEDQQASRRLLEVWLNKAGFQVESATDGLDAMAMLTADGAPDYRVVLMDCCIPSLNGVEATRRLRAWEVAEGRRPVRVIGITSADVDEFSRRNCLLAGMDEFAPKPLNLPLLGAIILRLLQD